jgi:uncharacterized membrane protein YciS (DUF1049 family)
MTTMPLTLLVLLAIIISIAFTIGWIVAKYRTETKIRGEQLRRELELQKMATFAEYLTTLQGGKNV